MWAREYFCGTVGQVDEAMIQEYIENQGKEDMHDNFEVAED